MIPEFSRIFNLEKIGAAPIDYSIKITPEEGAALAERFHILKVEKLEAKFELQKGQDPDTYDVEGVVHADVVQECIVSLVEVQNSLEFEFKIHLVQGDEDRFLEDLNWQEEAEKTFDLEFYQSMEIDLGEITAQYLSLELDLYPRAPGLPAPEFDVGVEDAEPKGEGEVHNPFAVLEKLKK